MRLALPLAALLLAGSCSSVTPFVVTGKSLTALDHQFADTAAAMNQALDAKQVTPEQYRTWADFARRFRAYNPLAVSAWKTAKDLGDDLFAGDFGAAISRLAIELGGFIAQLQEAAHANP